MKTVLLTILLMCLSGCNSNIDKASTADYETIALGQDTPEKELGSTMIEFQGTVKYITLEGGFYAIYADDGRKFMPRKLGELHRRHGLIVYVRGKILEGVHTIQQHGQVLDISSIEIIDDSKVGRLDEM